MIKYIKKLISKMNVNKKDKNVSSEIFKNKNIYKSCSNCEDKETCKYFPIGLKPCDVLLDVGDYKKDRETILIIDDNPGVCNFLKDDLYNIQKNKEFNIITICGKHAVFKLETVLKKYKIEKAIIDLTFGGSKSNGINNIKLNGIDAFEMLKKRKSDLHFLFYTGNNLNPYINSNKKIIDDFRKLNNDDIKNHIIFKTSLNIDERRKRIKEMLFI